MTQRIAYVVTRFPIVSETFILNEILELGRLGLQIEIFALGRQPDPIIHREAQPLMAHIRATRMVSLSMLAAQFYWLRRRPGAYLAAWWRVVRGNIGSRRYFAKSLAVVPLAACFARQMEKLGIERVHAHWATYPALAAYVVKRLTGLPYSFTAHAYDLYMGRPMLETKLREASFVVTVSDYNQRFLAEEYGGWVANKTVLIHYGIDPTMFQPRASHGNQDVFTIICVARLEEKKGHTYLIEACVHLKEQGIPFRCLLVGDGSYRAHLEDQIKRVGLDRQISLLGFQPQHRVRELLAEADVMVLPSIIARSGDREGIPVALIEALATELPAISTASSGIPELIEDGITGLLVPERDVEALASAIVRIYQSPELAKRLGTAGRNKVLKDFNLHRTAATLYELLTRDHVDLCLSTQRAPESTA